MATILNFIFLFFCLPLMANTSIDPLENQFQRIEASLTDKNMNRELDEFVEFVRNNFNRRSDYRKILKRIEVLRKKTLNAVTERWVQRCRRRGKIRICTQQGRQKCWPEFNPINIEEVRDFEVKNRLVNQAPRQRLKLSVISKEQADEVVSVLKNFDKIPNAYKADGCYARAHIAAQVLDELCIESGKAFLAGGSVSHNWSYHVSNLVLVENEGSVRPYILDPAFSTRALTIEDWASMVQYSPLGGSSKFYLKTKYYYDYGDIDKNVNNYRIRDQISMYTNLGIYNLAEVFQDIF